MSNWMKEGWAKNQESAWVLCQLDQARADYQFEGCWYDLPAFVRCLYENKASGLDG